MRFPIVNASEYVKFVAQLATVQRTLCYYCGNGNVVSGDTWVCFHCENVNRSTMLSMRLNDEDLVSALLQVNRLISNNEYLNAINEYQKVAAKYNDPEMLYNTGLMYLQYSNYDVSLIKYNRRGFMEENATYREEASALASKAKLILNKAAAQCQNRARAQPWDAFSTHTFFMANIKLRRLRSAQKALETQKGFGNGFLINYDSMVFSAETKDYAATAVYALKLLQRDMFSANAFYYLAWALFKSGRKREALALTNALGRELQNNSVLALAQEIQKSMRL